MAKGFSEEEREHIRNRLLEKGKEYFERYGVRKTNVADLSREAGIAKGSFYLFFESKEDLFLTINEEFDKQMQKSLAKTIEKSKNPKETFRKTLLDIIELFDSNPMLKLAVDKEEFESLTRKIPPEKFREHQGSSMQLLVRYIEMWQQEGVVRKYAPEVIAGAVKSLYYVVVHREFIGEDIFPQVVDLLIDSLVSNLATDKG